MVRGDSELLHACAESTAGNVAAALREAVLRDVYEKHVVTFRFPSRVLDSKRE